MIIYKRLHKRLGALLLVAGLMVGCSGGGGDGDRPETVPVSGTVTLDDQPLAGATVVFVNTAGLTPGASDKGHSGMGTTDAEGRFELRTFEPKDGAVPGAYSVTITKYQEVAGTSSGTAKTEAAEGGSLEGESYTSPGEATAESKSPVNELPEKYSRPTSSGLNATVEKGGENNFTFPLTSM